MVENLHCCFLYTTAVCKHAGLFHVNLISAEMTFDMGMLTTNVHG